MESWPIYYKDRLHIANLKSNVGIVTLWSPVQTILPKLNQKQFAIGGQLYSKRGINFLIRNILANPSIDTIIICGSNLSGSAEALINFIEIGVDEENNVIGVEKSPIDKEIDRESLEQKQFRPN
jgi:thymidylate synthase